MRARRSTLLLALGVAAATMVGLAALAAPAAAGAPGYVEASADNPVSAPPAVTRPATPHCTVTLARDFPSNAADGSPQSFAGTLTPPPACPGQWAKVVLDYTTTVSGRQYD